MAVNIWIALVVIALCAIASFIVRELFKEGDTP